MKPYTKPENIRGLMKTLKKITIATLVGLTATYAVASEKLGQNDLKQHAAEICVQAVNDTYGDGSIVSVRKRVDWQRDTSRLMHNDGLSASVRLLVRPQGNPLTRIICEVNQNKRITLNSLDLTAEDSSGWLAINGSKTNK